MVRCLAGFIALLMLFTAPVYAVDSSTPAQIPLPFKHVTLYTSGVGYFQRSGVVDGDATDTLYFPLSEINDVLKSLVLLDEGGGAIQPVTYAAKDPIGKQLQAFTVDVSDNPDRASLYNRLRGADVTVTVQPADSTGPAFPVTGVIVGVESQTEVLPDSQPEMLSTKKNSTLNVLAGDGIHSIPFEQIVTFKIDDASLDAELRAALSTVAQGRDSNKRPVKLSFKGVGRRDVSVGYVAEAPVWQSTYRLVLGKSPILQGWALVQNTSQDDWNGIDLTLVSGKPVSFIQDVYTPLYVQRPTIQSQLSAALAPVAYNSDMNAPAVPPAPLAEMPPAPVSMAYSTTNLSASISPVSAFNTNVANGAVFNMNTTGSSLSRSPDVGTMVTSSVGSTGAKLGDALFTYNISVPVTIPRQQSAMIPFTSKPIEAQRVAIYNSDVNADHPMTGARIVNTSGLHLLGGPITVFDEGASTSYVGDAIMDDTQPGQTRLISFALDSPVLADVDNGDGYTKTLGLKIVKGVLTMLVKEQTSTKYTFRNHGADDQTIVVEYPDPGSDWHILEPAKPTEHTATVYRFDLSAPAGKAATLKVVASHVIDQEVGLVDQGIDNILYYVKQGGAIAPEVKAKLLEVATRKRAIADTEAKLAGNAAQAAAINAAQGRIRENMKVLDHTSSLFKRYSDVLDTQETRLDNLNTERNDLNNRLASQRDSLSDYLSTLTIGTLPDAPDD